MKSSICIPDKKQVLMIAHRGLSGLETENTCAAFVAAGNHSYFGIETDVHRTKDGKFVVFHDDELTRMAGKELKVEETDFDTLRSLSLFETRFYKPRETSRCDLRIPTLAEYIAICRQYDKVAVLELKNHFEKDDIFRICDEIAALDWLDKTIFISFDFENLVFVREKHPAQTVQFLTGEVKDIDALLEKLAAHKFDWDAYHKVITKEIADKCRALGIRINVWTVDELPDAQRLIDAGVDFITSDILE